MSVARYIIKLLEPYIDAMITRRILMFHAKLVRDGAIPFVPSGGGKPLEGLPQSAPEPQIWIKAAHHD